MVENKKRVGCIGWGARFLVGFVVLIVILIDAGYAYQVKTTKDDFKRFPPPGKLVNIGEGELHIYCTGEGSPTVVVDTGVGDFSLGWGLVQPEVAKFTRICTYDRAGFGWSEPSHEARTAQQIATELHALLFNAGEQGPYILVGQSLGGLNVRMFASLYPEEVAGMVLVDSSHEDQYERFPQEFVENGRQQQSMARVASVLATFGVIRLLGTAESAQQMLPAYISELPKSDQEAYIALISHPAYFQTSLDEVGAFSESADQVRRITGDLGDLPLVVLTAGNSFDLDTLKALELPGEVDATQIVQVWFELQDELAALSTNSTHIIAEDSGHMIHIEQPEMVIEAIRQVVGVE